MEGFTPSFFLQLIIALGSGVGAFYAMKADLKNMHSMLEQEREAAKQHRAEDDQSFHDIRDKLSGHHGRLSRMEGASDLAERVVSAMKEAR